MLKIIIVATVASACISIACVILFVVVYRQRRKQISAPASQHPPLHPPCYTEIEFLPRGVPSSPPPRYKSEPDISARLNQQILIDSEGESESDEGM